MLTLLIESALRSLALGAVVWILLRAFRVRNPHIVGLAWKGVLAAALLMPAVMQWTAVTVPIPSVSWTSIEVFGEAATPVQTFSWSTAALTGYLIVAGALLLKYLANVLKSWRWARDAAPLARELNVKMSPSVRTPATFGSVILVPREFADWDASRRRAVLLHERAHIRNRDFHVQVAAQLHRIVFWFNPLAWWLPKQLSMLAEDISDDAAVSALSDRPLYAGMLLEMSTLHRDMPATLAMARPASVGQRIERILREERCAAAPGLARQMAVCSILLPLAVMASGASPLPETMPTGPTQTTPADTAPGIMPGGLSRPPYPAESKKAGEEGVVTLSLLIGEDGAVRDARVLKSTGFPRLDQAALAHVYNWSFRAATRNGKPTAVWHDFKLKFSLKDSEPEGTEPPRLLRAKTAPGIAAGGITRPPYPPESRQAGEEGTITLQLLVGEDGAVREVQLEKSSGFPRLDDAASRHAHTWRFNPATENGKPVAVWHSFRIKFSLDDLKPAAAGA